MSLSNQDPKSIDETLIEGKLGQIIRKARALSEISIWLSDQLPRELAYRCRVLNITPPKLILAAQDSATAMQLRYRHWELMELIEKHPKLNAIKEIEIRICPET